MDTMEATNQLEGTKSINLEEEVLKMKIIIMISYSYLLTYFLCLCSELFGCIVMK
ncbi:hypothetical protein RND71_042444 [Anisodus tanguticus]|uniref:Uncharacterized protein n=1 Tax=Anisodus tanguticus TaxID=243964 RepID=A0AAE1UP52_9SOLA|nr:hypothetical protein RND71_042444 [Anisodus tanguticus]